MPHPEPEPLFLPGVLVDDCMVGSSGFRARLDGHVSLALEGDAHHWTYVDDERPQVTAAGPPGRGPATELTLTGLVLPFLHPCMLGGWALDVGGVPILVSDQDSAAAGLRPAPAPGRWVRMRGALSVADGYVVDERERALQRPVECVWLVRRIISVSFVGRGGRVTARVGAPIEAIRFTGTSTSYVVDLQAAA